MAYAHDVTAASFSGLGKKTLETRLEHWHRPVLKRFHCSVKVLWLLSTKWCFIYFCRHHHRSILSKLVARPSSVQESLALFGKQVNPDGDCVELIADSFCHMTACLLPCFAAPSRCADPVDSMSGDEQKVKSAQARKSHDHLVSILTQGVSIRQVTFSMHDQPRRSRFIAKYCI